MGPTNVDRSPEPLPEPSLPARELPLAISPEGVSARLGKGQSAAQLPSNVLAVDTGQPAPPSEEDRQPRNQAELDEIYRATIGAGIVDHHTIDSTVRIPPGCVQRCATKMIADFPEEVLKLIDSRGITEITAHTDSDLDSIASSFLAKSLLDTRRLPAIGASIAEHTNQVDFGRYDERRNPGDPRDPELYLESLAGVFGAIRRISNDSTRAEQSKIYSNPDLQLPEKQAQARAISEGAQAALIRDVFEVLNACELYSAASGAFDPRNIDGALQGVSEALRGTIERGKALDREDFAQFNREFEIAQHTISAATIVDNKGQPREVPLIMFADTQLFPLVVTNMCYQRMPPETIIAVYAGPDRKKGGDCYDVGIKIETAGTFTLKPLEKPLNDAEAELRKPIIAELSARQSAGNLSAEERKKLDTWSTPRKGFEYLGQGDPTVCVAAGSLIASANTALLSREQFEQVVREALKVKPAS